MDSSWYDLENILPNVWRVNDGGLDTSYVVVGRQRAAVIDTGMGIGDLAGLVKRITDKPPLVVNTHAHPDHWLGNFQFQDTVMSEQEWAWVSSWQWPGPHVATVLDDMPPMRPYPPCFDRAAYPLSQPTPTWLVHHGDIIDLGETRLEVIAIPAHTPGGIALLDRAHRLLFCGDTVQRSMLWLQLDESSDHDTVGATYDRLGELAGNVDHMLPGHGQAMLPGSFLKELRDGMRMVLRGEVAPRWQDTFAGGGWYYGLGGYGPVLRERV